MLQSRALTSGYLGTPVLHGIDLTVGAGEAVAILGANGAGKTTLAKTLARVLPVLSGTISWKDHDVTAWNATQAARAGIGYVPQEENVFGEMTVRENLEVSADGNPGARSLIDDFLQRFPILEARSRQDAATLSGGERQILALVSALVMQPEVILLDEPTTGLAPLIVNDVCRIVQEMVRDGIGVLWIVEQDPEVVLELVDKAYVMGGGQILGEHSADELRSASPADLLLTWGGAAKKGNPELD